MFLDDALTKPAQDSMVGWEGRTHVRCAPVEWIFSFSYSRVPVDACDLVLGVAALERGCC